MAGAQNEMMEKAAIECAAAAALDALMAGAAAAEGAFAPIRLAPGIGFAAKGAPGAVAHEGSRAALFYGAAPPASWPVAAMNEETEPITPAQRVLSLVSQLSDMLPNDAVEAAVAAMRSLSEEAAPEGGAGEDEGFALVAFDAESGMLIAARDSAGAAELHWGVTPGGLLLIGADLADLEGCFPSAAPFPAGAVFASRGAAGQDAEPGEAGFVIVGGGGATAPGRLASFVPRAARSPASAGRPPLARGGSDFKAMRAVPRVNEAGVLCGSVFRVASEGESLVDLTRPRQVA